MSGSHTSFHVIGISLFGLQCSMNQQLGLPDDEHIQEANLDAQGALLSSYLNIFAFDRNAENFTLSTPTKLAFGQIPRHRRMRV